MISPPLLHYYYIFQSSHIFNSISAHIPQFNSSSKQSKTPSQPPQRHLIPSLHFYFFHSRTPTFLLHFPPRRSSRLASKLSSPLPLSRAPARRTAGDEPFRHHLLPTGSSKNEAGAPRERGLRSYHERYHKQEGAVKAFSRRNPAVSVLPISYFSSSDAFCQ